MREGPGVKYAREYVEKLNRPLTEDDIAHAFSHGAIFGHSSVWHRIEDSTPAHCQGEQIVVLSETGKFTYDMAVVPAEEYLTFIGNRDNGGIPVLWAYFRVMVGKRVKLPRRKKEEEKIEKVKPVA